MSHLISRVVLKLKLTLEPGEGRKGPSQSIFPGTVRWGGGCKGGSSAVGLGRVWGSVDHTSRNTR